MKNLFKLTALGAAILAAPGALLAKDVSETRDVDTFTRIVVENSADIVVNVGGSQRVEIKADDEIMQYVTTEVKNGTLYVGEDAPRKLWRHHNSGIKLNIQVKNLDGVEVDGSGDIEVHNIDSNSFGVAIDGSGDIDLDGSCGGLSISVSGSGDVDSRTLKCKTAELEIDGSGDVDVYASESVRLEINGSGDVTVYGDPANVRPTFHGSGELDYADEK